MMPSPKDKRKPDPTASTSSSTENRSGGAGLAGKKIKVGKDVVGRDKKTTVINIEPSPVIVIIFIIIVGVLIVTDGRLFSGLGQSAPTTTAVGPTHTATSALQPAATPTNSPTPTSTPTPPEVPIRALVEAEARAALTRDINLTHSIFAPDAVRLDAANEQARNAYEAYAEIFGTLTFIDAAHGRIDIAVAGDTATAVSDSCGSFATNNGGAKVDFGGPQSDRWAFKQNANGQWQIKRLTINLPSTGPQQRYTFEDNTRGCWLVRIDGSVPQGVKTSPSDERAHAGQISLRFDYDTAQTKEHRGQVAHIHMPFAGRASAWIYAPPDAPVDLEAGFFAMELDHEPWQYHAPDQLFPLTPGQWTQITWDTDVTGWAQPLHQLGIEVRRSGGGDHLGYVLIDDITITSQ